MSHEYGDVADEPCCIDHELSFANSLDKDFPFDSSKQVRRFITKLLKLMNEQDVYPQVVFNDLGALISIDIRHYDTKTMDRFINKVEQIYEGISPPAMISSAPGHKLCPSGD